MAVFHTKRKKTCYFTDHKIEKIDFTDYELLRKYVSDRGKILPRRTTGACSKHQRDITTAVNRCRTIAMLPFEAK